MYTNVAYLNNSISVVKDTSKPLIVTSCGYYKVENGPVIKTNRPKGRRDYQLLYIIEGKAHFYFDGVERIVHKGEMVLFRPYDHQSYFYYPRDKCQVYWVHFTGSEVDKILDYYKLPNDRNIFYSSTSPDYQWLFEQMIRELQLCRTNYKELLTMNLRHIFLLIHRYVKEHSKSGSGSINEIEHAIRHFNVHYKKNINIEEYAKSLHISPCWFNRRFKQITKVTPLQYILSLRIANAKSLLEAKDYNITEIAFEVGFNDPLYFTRVFSKSVGITPTEYRKIYSES